MPLHLREHLALIAVELMADCGVVVIGQECGSPDGHSRSNRYCKSKLIWKCGFPKPGIGEQTQVEFRRTLAFKEEEGAELLEAATVGSCRGRQRRDLCLCQLCESHLSSCSLHHRDELGRGWKLTGSV